MRGLPEETGGADSTVGESSDGDVDLFAGLE